MVPEVIKSSLVCEDLKRFTLMVRVRVGRDDIECYSKVPDTTLRAMQAELKTGNQFVSAMVAISIASVINKELAKKSGVLSDEEDSQLRKNLCAAINKAVDEFGEVV